jgi:hypothetical protein
MDCFGQKVLSAPEVHASRLFGFNKKHLLTAPVLC